MGSAADRRIFWGAAFLVVTLDVLTKLVAEATLLLTPGIPVVGDWFQLRLVYNRGAAFGLHVGPYSRWVFFAVAVLAVFVLNRMSLHTSPGDRFRQLALGLVAGGAAGNLIDRIRSSRGVVDFLDVGVGALRRRPEPADLGERRSRRRGRRGSPRVLRLRRFHRAPRSISRRPAAAISHSSRSTHCRQSRLDRRRGGPGSTRAGPG
jgi:lipoprotein signal peptidase